MGEEELRGYYSLSPEEQLLLEGYIQKGLLGGNLTAKGTTPAGDVSVTGGGNYNVRLNEFDPYGIAKLSGDGYNVQGTIDKYNKAIEAGLYGDNYNAKMYADLYQKALSGGYGNDYANMYGNITQSVQNPDYISKTLGGKIGNIVGSVNQTPDNLTKTIGYETPTTNINYTQDNYGNTLSGKKLFELFGGQGFIEGSRSPYDKRLETGIEWNF